MNKATFTYILNVSTGKSEAADMMVKSDGAGIFSVGEVRVGSGKEQIYPFTPDKRDLPNNHKAAPGSIYFKNFRTGHVYEVQRIPADVP